MDTLTSLNDAQSEVHFQLMAAGNNRQIAIATLNAPKALNALNLTMIRLLNAQLTQWQHDDSIALIVLTGEGEKAFCAGGDVVSLHNAMKTGEPANYGETFFSEEYALDYLIHTYEKPIVVWGSGIVMGGGMGLMAGASHRVVTQSSKLAMPEITIGLYPDVGASYFLQQMPEQVGLFLGLTGALMNADDARFASLADYSLDSDKFNAMLGALAEQNWQTSHDANHQLVSLVLSNLESQSQNMPAGGLRTHLSAIEKMAEFSTLTDKVAYLSQLQSDDKWLNRAIATLKKGSPLSANLIEQQLIRAKGLSLKDCFKMELIMSVACCEAGEFQEGVRALLIDKDMQPNWQHSQINQVTEQELAPFFTSKWATHPLEHL